MGRALASTFPTMITYHELPGATHNILERAARCWRKPLRGARSNREGALHDMSAV